MKPEPIIIQPALKAYTKEQVLERIELFLANDLAKDAEQLRRDYKHIISPDVPLGSQRFLEAYITQDPYMRTIKTKIGLAASQSDTILISGPTGSGKELFARALHGDRKDDSFVGVNCAGLPSGLIESELFGHAKGSFTGATESKKGLFSQATDGTIFLDEVGELPMDVQAKLLRVIQERAIRRVGSNIHEHVNARIVCATHQDLEKLVSAGKFREDLYWRINTLGVRITGLVERPADIPLIVDYIATRYETELRVKKENHFPRDYVFNPTLLQGNVRSIQSIIRRYHVWKELPPTTTE